MAKADWAEDWKAQFLERVSTQVRSLENISKDADMPGKTRIYDELNEDEKFADDYAHAREARADNVFEETFEIADNANNDWMAREGESAGYELNGEHVQRSRLRLDQRKWALARMAPKKYGDKLALDVEVATKTLTPEQQIDAVQKLIPQIAPILIELGWRAPE